MEKNKLKSIEDWKNDEKINVIRNLIISRSINKKTLLSLIGNQSKKTYQNGEIIDDASLPLKKFFDSSYKEKCSQFYIKLDEFKELFKNRPDKELIENTIYEILKLIQANTVCSKYDEKQLLEYKTKISDILETRDKEEQLFKLFNQLEYENLASEHNHEALRFLLENGWDETKEKYLWLTELITFINNGSITSKEYLITLFKLKPIENTDYSAKKLLIKLVAKKSRLNINRIDEIIDFVFSIGNYYKHGTYYKWYQKEFDFIQLFENKNDNIQISTLIERLNLSAEHIEQLKNLINDYQKMINEHFN